MKIPMNGVMRAVMIAGVLGVTFVSIPEGVSAKTRGYVAKGSSAQATNILFSTAPISHSYIYTLVKEADQGYTDLNGDGDTSDSVIYRYHNGTPENLAHAVVNDESFSADGSVIAFLSDEAGQGNIDLNGDGDMIDQVLHVNATNLGLACSVVTVGGYPGRALAVFWVDEAGQGHTDLNGDGDAEDWVIHVYDVQAGTTHNLELAQAEAEGSIVRISADGRWVAFWVHEEASGDVDLNRDGETLDPHVLHLYDAQDGMTTNVGQATARTSDLEFDQQGTRIVFSVSEGLQGEADLNGDGDADDSAIIHIYETATRIASNLRLAGAPRVALINDEGTRLVFAVHEGDQGGQDLNGDGDADDQGVLYIHDVASHATINLDWAAEKCSSAMGIRDIFSMPKGAVRRAQRKHARQ